MMNILIGHWAPLVNKFRCELEQTIEGETYV
jgi:hypothetical protein